MKRLAVLLSVLCSLGAATCWGANDRSARLQLTTQDDDLRAGGVVVAVLRMRDGTEQTIPLITNEPLAGHTTREFDVGPRAPFDWADVEDFGLRVRTHPGDGLLLQPDRWKVYVVLRGIGSGCVADRLPPGEPCFTNKTGSLEFRGERTHFMGLNPVIGHCNGDLDCGDGTFCSARVARCDPRARGADPMGCVRLPAPQPACGSGQVCLESEKRCTIAGCENGDSDGDGMKSVACGGNDCDDNDARRFPGNAEICDTAGHDEDCDASTIGTRDSDGDGFVDAACWNDGRRF